MPKVKGVNTTGIWGYDKLLPILQDAFRVLFVSYQTVYAEKQKKPYVRPTNAKKWHLEDLITNDLVKKSIKIPKKLEYRIQKQQEDIETNSKIDIAVLYSLTFGDNSCDLKIECKRLDNLHYLLNDGIIDGFKNNKYSEKLPIAGMLAYNTSDTIQANINLLNTKIEKNISKAEKLKTFLMPDINTETYKSTHQRIDDNFDIDIYTMALDFEDVIT